MQASVVAKRDWKLLFEMVEKSQLISAAFADLLRTPEGQEQLFSFLMSAEKVKFPNFRYYATSQLISIYLGIKCSITKDTVQKELQSVSVNLFDANVTTAL